MSGTNKERASRHGLLKFGASAHRHHHRRRKRFRVRPEATGVGYERFTGWSPPTSLPAATSSPPPEAPQPAAAILAVEDSPEAIVEPISEKEAAHTAARRGVRLCLMLLAFLVVLVYERARFGSFKGIAHWWFGNLPQPVVVERPAKSPPTP